MSGFSLGFAAGEEFLRNGKAAVLPKAIKAYGKICDFWSGYNTALSVAETMKKYEKKNAYEA